MLSKSLMPICLVTAVIASFFGMIVLITANNSDNVLTTLNWAFSDTYSFGDFSYTLYLNVYTLGAKYSLNGNDDIDNGKWSDSTCNTSSCDDCQTNMQVVYAFSVMFFLFSLPSIYFNILRFKDGNTQWNRWLGIILADLAILCGVIALVDFTQGCLNEVIDNENDEGQDIDWNYGAAFGLLATGVVLQAINSLFNSLIGVDPALVENQA